MKMRCNTAPAFSCERNKAPRHTHDPHSTTTPQLFHMLVLQPFLICFALFSLKKKIFGVVCPLTDSFTDFTSTELTHVGVPWFLLP